MDSSALTRILVVDDDPDLREIETHALERGGFSTLACGSIEEARNLAPGFRPQLMLIDVVVGGRDGSALYRELAELPGLERTPVVFMSTDVATVDISSYLRAGALDVITKPFDYATIADQVREIWTERS